MAADPTRRAIELLRTHGPNVVDPHLATLEHTVAPYRWRVLLRSWSTTEPYLVAHRAAFDPDTGELRPACNVNPRPLFRGATVRWVDVPPGVAAVFARACGRCSWPPFPAELELEEPAPSRYLGPTPR